MEHITYWSDELLIGVAEIDAQHRKLVSALDALPDDCARGRWSEAIEKTLKFVVAYAQEHFAQEERLQAACGFPEMEEHKRMHASFVADVSALVGDIHKNGREVAMIGKINKMLSQWVIHHIGTEDKKIGLHIQRSA